MTPLPPQVKPATPIGTWYLYAALAWIVVVAALGLWLRLALAGHVSIEYKYWLHGHSHIAFMGWIFNALVAGYYYSIPSRKSRKAHVRLFGLIQVAVLGMAITFPIQGYGPLSITFSTLHVIFTAVLAVWSIRDGQVAAQVQQGLSPGLRWWIAGISWMLISSLGPFALGYFMANDMGHTAAYQLSIYFYLHFQYNGWFFFGLIAIWLFWLSRIGVSLPINLLKISWWLFWLAMPLTYALSALWLDPPAWIRWIGGVAAFAQLLGLGFLFSGVYKMIRQRNLAWTGVAQAFLALVALLLCIKLVLQILSVYPDLAALAFNRLTVIAYLHLVFLGIITTGLLALFWQGRIIHRNSVSRRFLTLFILAFILVEIFMLWPVLFGQAPPGDGLVWSTALLSLALGGFGLTQWFSERVSRSESESIRLNQES